MNLKQLIAYFSTALILLSCAQIVPLTGGDKDVNPPKEIESTPKNGSINFSEKTITIEFDEYIKLTNVTSQLIVSPLMETPPEILVKGKKLVIKIESELTENTTYSLNFGNAITDITENNVFPNYKYVFSTGTYIDSLSYSGTVVNAFDLSKKENIYVLLYDQFGDSVPYKELPRYVALTDDKGAFSITNIANGEYKFFAINDINGNYLFDLPNEEIAFREESVIIDSSSSDNLTYLFEEESDLQFLDKIEHKKYGKVDVRFNLPTENLDITLVNKTVNEKIESWSINEGNKTGDSLTLWLWPNAVKDLEHLILEFKDESGIIDTAEIQVIDKSEFKDTSFQIITNISGSFDLAKNIILTIERPFVKYQTDSIKLFEDSVLVTTSYFEDIGLRKFELAYDFKENTNYQLFIPPGTFTDMLDLKNDTLKIDFKTKSESDYGIINLSINPNFSQSYIVQLYKGKKLVHENHLKGTDKIDYKYLSPGSYKLKLIIDINGDNKWNTGNYMEGIQPEKVIYYKKEIKIRSNWDNDIIWTINE